MVSKQIYQYLFLYLCIYLIPYAIDFAYVYNTGNLLGDLSFYKLTTTLDKVEILYIFLNGLVYTFFGLALYILIFSKKLKCSVQVKYSRKRLESILIIVLILQAYFSFKYKIGSAGGHSENRLSTLMNLINVELFFPIYYLIFRKDINRRFVFVVIIYCFLKVIQGWSGFILSLFFIELFYRCTNKKLSFYFFLLIPLLFFIGGFLYKYMYPLKTYIRFNEFKELSYGEALIKLVSRISTFSNSCCAYENQNQLLKLNKIYSRDYAELLYFLNPIVPGGIYDKSFKPFNTLLLKAAVSNTAGFSNFDLGATYYYLLYKSSILQYLYYFIILIVNAFMMWIYYAILTPIKNSNFIQYAFSTYFIAVLLVGGGLNMQSIWIISIFTVFFLKITGAISFYKI